MNLFCKITADENLIDIFNVEQDSRNRSSLNITQENNQTHFLIKAKDPVALRASTNLVTKLLISHEKIKSLVKNGCSNTRKNSTASINRTKSK